jgi:hypothetical protein
MANTWTKITARYGYPMVRNGKEPENPLNLLVAATFEKAITYVFAESAISQCGGQEFDPPLLHQ